MKKLLKLIILSSAVTFSHQAFAYNSGNVEEKCKDPSFKRFSLPEYKAPERIEVSPESEFSFIIPRDTDATTLRVTAKKKKLAVEVETKDSFHIARGKLPAEFTGKFVRISVEVIASLGCKGKDGWLIKVASETKPEEKVEVEVTPEPNRDTETAPSE